MKNQTNILVGIIFWLCVILIFISCKITFALPLQLTVQPEGTNQVELTIAPVIQGGVYGVLARTNGPDGHWTVLGPFYGYTNKALSVTCEMSGGMTLETLNNWKFVAGNWDYSPYYDIPPLAKELIFRTDPSSYVDPNGNIMGDGWSNIQKFQNNMDPFCWVQPAPPQLVSVTFNTNHTAKIYWRQWGGATPDYFVIEKAERTLNTNRMQLPYGRSAIPFGRTNIAGYPGIQRQPFQPNGQPYRRSTSDAFVTGPFHFLIKIAPSSAHGLGGYVDYHYTDINVDTFFQPAYRIQAHYSPPPHAHLSQVTAAAIRETILPVTSQQTTNGYDLTAMRPIPYAWYLLLVRDKTNPQWRASGYFASGKNRNPVHLHVNSMGMMSEGQSPIAMPEVKFLPDVVDPEFTAGWGEDSDGDGLPDIYEVLVTQTDPDNADTGNTGTLDGYKDMALDGWSNLEKFRYRSNPLKTAYPPPTVELIKPSSVEILKAISRQTDLPYELQLEVRTNGATNYQPIENVPEAFYSALNYREQGEHRNFDLRVSWRVPQAKSYSPGDPNYSETPTPEQTIKSLEGRVNLRMFETFSNNLANKTALSRNALSNNMAAIEHAYRQGEIDKGIAMAEMMTLSDNQSQDFYGKVIDQNGQPVVGADVTLGINLAIGQGASQKTQTDSAGLFQFTGIKGQSLSITPKKEGYQIEGHGLGLKGLNGPDTSPDNREIYTMWKLKGPEPMMHGEVNSRKIVPDGRWFTIDFLKNEITEGTNDAGDLFFQIKRPPEVKPRERYDWSFTMTGINGGFIEVTNDAYLNEAPEFDYEQQYQMVRYATNVLNYSTYQLYRTDRTFFLKSRGGQIYGHFYIKDLDPDYRGGMAALRIEYYINPAGSRNLEFDPTKQIK